MKHIVFFAAMALSAAAWAQAPKPEPIQAEPIKPEAARPQPESAPAVKKAAKPAAAMAKKNSRRSEDARQCLERPTNDEIIRCAEEYL
jgi:hypothetical protein